MKSSNNTVRFEVDQHLARITFDSEKKHNSLGAEEIATLNDCFEHIDANQTVRALILTGAGERTFCAGAALDQLSSGAITPEAFSQMTRSLATLRVPSICALNGSVYGGGCEVALSCDFRIGMSGMRAFVPAAKFGLCYPPSGIARLVTCLGLSNARRFLLLAEEFSGPELLQMGFLTQTVSDESPLEAAESMAQVLLTKAPLAVQAMKEISQQISERSLDEERITELVRLCAESRDLQEGLLAAREKRAPRFEGV